MANLTEQAKALYLYGFPLVVTEATHWGADDKTFQHLRTFPTDKANKIVKMNNDTLYSTAWTQLARTPYLVHIPKITERYYLFPILDAYTNVVESIGTRTPERAEGDYLLLYRDTPVPAGYESYRVIRLQDSLNAVLLRIETRGKADYPVVNRIQDSITIRPLYPERVRPVRKAPKLSPAVYVETIFPKEFFTLFAALSAENPIRDEAYVRIFEAFGYDRTTGAFSWDALTAEQQQALTEGSRLGFAEIQAGRRNPQYSVQHRGWLSVIGGVGTYGTDYLQRAITAYSGWGANIIQDSAYVIAAADDSGAPLDSRNRYRLHIPADGYPHASVFWSITLYGEPSKYLVPNPIERYKINTYDLENGSVEKNPDGSLDVYISAEAPEDALARKNWLPSPAEEEHFTLALRVYTPDELTIRGEWEPPVLERI